MTSDRILLEVYFYESLMWEPYPALKLTTTVASQHCDQKNIIRYTAVWHFLKVLVHSFKLENLKIWKEKNPGAAEALMGCRGNIPFREGGGEFPGWGWRVPSLLKTLSTFQRLWLRQALKIKEKTNKHFHNEGFVLTYNLCWWKKLQSFNHFSLVSCKNM